MSRHAKVSEFVREFLPADFASRVLERFAEHDQTLDTSYEWASLRAFQAKLGDEVADVAGYCAILATRTEDDRARALLAAIAQHAGKAHQLVGELERLLVQERAA